MADFLIPIPSHRCCISNSMLASKWNCLDDSRSRVKCPEIFVWRDLLMPTFLMFKTQPVSHRADAVQTTIINLPYHFPSWPEVVSEVPRGSFCSVSVCNSNLAAGPCGLQLSALFLMSLQQMDFSLDIPWPNQTSSSKISSEQSNSWYWVVWNAAWSNLLGVRIDS